MIGYSLNDTIIIFDRVRENLKKARKEPLYEMLNRSINETLPRSILTHATVAAVDAGAAFFGGEVIRPFAWVMAFGIFTGTFSSIYVAAPILLWIERKWPRKTWRVVAAFIDSHAHLADPAFDGDRDAVIAARARGGRGARSSASVERRWTFWPRARGVEYVARSIRVCIPDRRRASARRRGLRSHSATSRSSLQLLAAGPLRSASAASTTTTTTRRATSSARVSRAARARREMKRPVVVHTQGGRGRHAAQ